MQEAWQFNSRFTAPTFGQPSTHEGPAQKNFCHLLRGKALELERHHVHIVPQGWCLYQVKASQVRVAKHNSHTNCFSNRKEQMGQRGLEIHCSSALHLNGMFERNLNGAWHTLPHQDKAGSKTPSTYMWAQVNPLLEYTWRLKGVSNSCSHAFTQWKGRQSFFQAIWGGHWNTLRTVHSLLGI